MMQRPEMPPRQPIHDRHAPAGDRAHTERRVWLLVSGVVLLVFLVALGSSRSLAHVGGPGDLAGARLLAGDLIVLGVAIAVVPAVLFALWQSLHGLREEGPLGRERRRERSLIKQVLIIALVGGVLAALALGRPQSRDRGGSPAGPRPGTPPAAVKTVTPRSERAAENLFPWVVTGVGTCLVLLLTTALIQRRRRSLATVELVEDELATPRRELHELFGISIAEIEQEADPRRAVIRAYAGMEGTLARHGLGRHRHEAPGEYLGRVFATLQLSRRPSERLTELFERARFSTHPIEPEMKRESIAALTELRGELEAKQ